MGLRHKKLFEGKLVRLTAIRSDDAEIMARWQEDSEFLRNVDTDMAVPYSEESMREADGSGTNPHDSVEFRLRTIEEDELIGFVVLLDFEWNNRSAKLAIGIGESENRGKGYGTDALELILRFAFHELNLNRVGLEVISYNDRALAAYKKAGFQEEGRMRQAVLRDGGKFDLILMGILREEWEKSHAPTT